MSYELRIGLLAAICIAVTVWGYKFMKGKNLLNRSNYYFARYSDIDELSATSPVLIHGLRVGTVSKVELQPDMKTIIATLDVNRGIHFPKHTEALIVNTSIMGGKAVVLDVLAPCGGSDCAARGDTLTGRVEGLLESMFSGQDIDDYWTKVKSGLGDVITDISDSLSKEGAANEFAVTFRALQGALVNLESLTRQLDRGMVRYDARLEKSLAHIESLTGNLANNNVHISSAIASLDTFATDLKEARIAATAGETLKSLESTLEKADQTFAELNGIMASVNSSDGTLGKLVHDKELYDNLNETSRQLSLLLQDFRLNPKRYVNVSVFGKKQREYEIPESDPAERE